MTGQDWEADSKTLKGYFTSKKQVDKQNEEEKKNRNLNEKDQEQKNDTNTEQYLNSIKIIYFKHYGRVTVIPDSNICSTCRVSW